MVCIVGDVARGDKYKPFQVHELPQVGLLQQVTKGVFAAQHAAEIPGAVRQAFQLAMHGEPGPTAVVVPYNLLIETHRFHCPPLGPREVPFDEAAFAVRRANAEQSQAAALASTPAWAAWTTRRR